jgi:arabinose-5-phosphate isomerase
LLALLPALKRKGVPIIALTGRPQSTLATEASIHLDAGVEKEACPLGLAPTASTTAALALGDALAVALLDARDFKPEDFALSHPGGSLGRKLLVHISDLMHGGEALPRVNSGSSLKDALLEMTRKGLGMTAICAADGQLLGIFTDGDLRRTLDKSLDLAGLRIDDVMARQPRTIESHRLATEAANEMEHHKINGLLVTDRAGNLVGALNMHDLLKAGVV